MTNEEYSYDVDLKPLLNARYIKKNENDSTTGEISANGFKVNGKTSGDAVGLMKSDGSVDTDIGNRGLSVVSGKVGHSNSRIQNPPNTEVLKKIQYDEYGHIISVDDLTAQDIGGIDGVSISDTTYDAENGIALNNGKFGHSDLYFNDDENSYVFKKIKYDKYGHIKDVSDINANDIGGISGVEITDTTYQAEKGISLNDGKFGHSNKYFNDIQDSYVFKKIKYDEYGHIKDTTNIDANDIGEIPGVKITDTTYQADNDTLKLGADNTFSIKNVPSHSHNYIPDSNNSVKTNHIDSGAVTNGHLAGNIEGTKLSNKTITGGKIADNTINFNKISSESIGEGNNQLAIGNHTHNTYSHKLSIIETVSNNDNSYHVRFAYNNDIIYIKYSVLVPSNLITAKKTKYSVNDYEGTNIWPTAVQTGTLLEKPPHTIWVRNNGTANLYGGVDTNGDIVVISPDGPFTSSFVLHGIVSYPRNI